MDKKSLIEIGVFLVLIVVLIFFIVKVNSDGAKCMTSPLKFAQIDYSKSNNSTATCICHFENIRIMDIVANKSGVFSKNPSYAIQ